MVPGEPSVQGAKRLHSYDRNLDGPVRPDDEEQGIGPGGVGWDDFFPKSEGLTWLDHQRSGL